MIKNILFDFDGTLVDTAPGIVETMKQTFLSMQIVPPSDGEMRATIGLPLGKALAMLGNLDEEQERKAVETYRNLFFEYELGNLKVFDGVVETLKTFKNNGIRMAIVTSRDESSLSLIIKLHHLEGIFEICSTATEGLAPKPAPDMVNFLIAKMNINKDETLVVGDTTFDIGMGNNAGCKTCAVTYGNHTKDQLLKASPYYIIDSFDTLIDIVNATI